jgi:hypothetical protein
MPVPSTQLLSDVVLFQNLFQDAATFCTPYFDAAIAYYNLFRGKRPWQLDATSSQVMVNKAFAMIEDRLPKLKKNVFAGEDFVSLEAQTPLDEVGVDDAQAWLRALLKDEDKINILYDIDSTFLSALVCGTGYRMPFARKNKQGKWYVGSRNIDYFQILPAPVGGKINPQDPDDDDALPYFFHVDWMDDDQLKALSKFEGFQKDEAEKLFKTAVQNEAHIGYEYEEKFRVIGGVSYGDRKNDWRSQFISATGGKEKGCKRRVVHWHSRIDNCWRIIVQDNFMIFKGPLPLGDKMLSLSKYSITNDFDNWMGIGAIEMVQDIIVAYLLNRNYRLDHIGRVMFPAKWIREQMFAGHSDSDFYDKPYSIYHVPASLQNVRLQDLFYYDRAPEVSPQTFMEDREFVELMEVIGGSPDMAKNMTGSNTASSTATGALSFINQVSGRIDAESMLLEFGGLCQEARQLLILGDKYINDEEFVRDARSPNGMGWRKIDSAYLGDKYVVRSNGTKSSADQAQKFQRLMSLYPLWNASPLIDQVALNTELAESAGISNLKEIISPPSLENQSGAPMGAPVEQGGLAAPQNLQNRNRSVQKGVNQPL